MTGAFFNLGTDFLYAKVHGWWSRSAHGEILEALTRSATEDNFFHQLQNYGILAVSGPERVLEQFLLRQYGRLRQLGERTSPAFRKYLGTLCDALERENLKTILNYRFFPEREAHLSDTLVRFPSRIIREDDLLALLDATGTEQFIRLLPTSPNREKLAEIIRQLDKDRDIMRMECALDSLSYQEEFAAIRHLDRVSRETLSELRGRAVDHTNITTLLRNASFYHLAPKALDFAWVEGGRELARDQFDRLALLGDIPSVIAALPGGYRSLLQKAQSGEASLASMDHLLHCHLARRARKCFYDSVNPRRALAVYPLLLEQETVNLSRIYEGIRFNLPARDIAAMMIQ